MGKQRRKEERPQRRHLRAVGEHMPGRNLFPQPIADELETRPEYIANMKAWRAAGCPPGPGAFGG